MKKINRIAWNILASASLIVGLWVLIAEGTLHSKFYVFFFFSLIVWGLLYIKRIGRQPVTKRKKRR